MNTALGYFSLLILLIGFACVKIPVVSDKDNYECYTDDMCTNQTIDNFSNCLDLGYESTGFLSREHYYLCDGIKITNTCLEYDTISASDLSVGEIFFKYHCEKKKENKRK